MFCYLSFPLQLSSSSNIRGTISLEITLFLYPCSFGLVFSQLMMVLGASFESLTFLYVWILFDTISGPREDATRIGSAGVVRRQAVDISPLRRVNQAIYLLTTGAREAAFRNIKTVAECLADELINAAKGSSNRYATIFFQFMHLY